MGKILSLSPQELRVLKPLNTPQKIQSFLDTLAINYEKQGETCMSPRRVLRTHRAHCLEGAMLAGLALWIHGEKPLLLNLQVLKGHGDDDHAVILFKQNGRWGAISKTNHPVLRYRDPIYHSPRELAFSYYHEYFLSKNGKKTLRGYSKPINLKRFGTKWVTDEKDLWDIAESIYDMPHTSFVPKGSERLIRLAHPLERKASNIVEWSRKSKRT
jgi:hypothetical protein